MEAVMKEQNEQLIGERKDTTDVVGSTLDRVEARVRVLEKLMSEPMFQTHRSCYVNLKYVHNYSKSDGVVMTTGTWLPLARQRQDEFLLAMGKFLRRG